MSDQTDTPDAEYDPDAKVVIKLRKPITIGQQPPVEEFVMRPIEGKDMRYMPVDELRKVAGVMWMAGRLSGQTQAVTDKLSGSDLKRVMKTVNDFLGDGPETGDEPSES